MKITQTPARFYPYIGGVENTVYYLSRELVKAGHRVRVICADEPGASPAEVAGIQVKRLQYIGKVANTNITPGLFRSIMAEECDLIHTHLPCPWSADVSALVCRHKRKPLFLSFHNNIVGKGVHRATAVLYNRIFLPVLLRTARRIFIAQKNYLDFSIPLQRFREKVEVVPFGVDTEQFRPLEGVPSGRPSIFFLSRLDRFHRYKGLDSLLMALKPIASATGLKLYVGGDGELRPFYEELVRQHGLTDIVEFLGVIPQSRLPEYYNRCTVFVLPSITAAQEGFGLVALEAMACRKPVIISDIVGVAEEVRSHEAGIVVKAGDSGELTEALRFMIDHPEKRLCMAERGWRLAQEKHSWKNYALSVMSQYERYG